MKPNLSWIEAQIKTQKKDWIELSFNFFADASEIWDLWISLASHSQQSHSHRPFQKSFRSLPAWGLSLCSCCSCCLICRLAVERHPFGQFIPKITEILAVFSRIKSDHHLTFWSRLLGCPERDGLVWPVWSRSPGMTFVCCFEPDIGCFRLVRYADLMSSCPSQWWI